MYFENKTLENITAEQELLVSVMKKNGLECHGGWDFDRMTFDKRFDLKEGRFYLRVFCKAVSGDVGNNTAILKIQKPALGKYYYPHGVEYDENEEVFPTHLVKECEGILENVKKLFATYGVEA
ncbi:YugN-like protein OS=Ureibacillus acetophenoni OX=614649 GN=SAMN05877842_101353 PE=4 SV=1 [Ureibacillus acetophenoni]